MKKLAILLFCLFFGLASCSNLQAQASFMVSFVKGSCLLNDQPLVLGSSFDLQETDKISIAGALVLWHLPTGSTVRMPNAGVWKAEHLLTQLQLAQTSTGSKMVSFILDKLIADAEDINQNRHEYMMAIAASEKNRQDLKQFITSAERKEPASVLLFHRLPIYQVYATSSVCVAWFAVPQAASYRLVLQDKNDKVVQSITTTDTLHFVNLNSADFPEKKAKITISVPNLPQQSPASLTLQPVSINPTAWAVLEADLSTFLANNQLPTQPTQTVEWLALASFFVQKGLVIDALGAYRQALNTASEAEQAGVRAVYEVFLRQYAKSN